jgi:hypothetical protein
VSGYDQRKVPPFCKVGKHQRMVDPSTLTQHQKQTVWKGIKTENPALADMLQHDANIAALKAQLGATIRFSVEDINSYTQAGLRAIEERKS